MSGFSFLFPQERGGAVPLPLVQSLQAELLGHLPGLRPRRLPGGHCLREGHQEGALRQEQVIGSGWEQTREWDRWSVQVVSATTHLLCFTSTICKESAIIYTYRRMSSLSISVCLSVCLSLCL